MSSTSFSVQPVDLGAKLQKVNFGSERFQLEGYTTYHDIFAQKTAYNGHCDPLTKELAIA